MHPVRRQRLFVVLFIVLAAAAVVALGIMAMGSNMNLFYTPTEIASGKAPANVRIRAGGMVVKGSLERAGDSLAIRFAITDGSRQLPVRYSGIVPDLFAEEEAALVVGAIGDDGVLQADEVLARHDENYRPPEIRQAVAKGRQWQQQQLREAGDAPGAERGE